VKVPILALRPTYTELSQELDQAYRRVMDSGHYLLGPELVYFEKEYAQFSGTKYCIGVSNGLEALQLCLMAKKIGKGDEVIVPAHGYIATWLAVTHVGATPIPCECSESTYNLDPLKVQRLISANTKAILPIDLYGQTANYPELRKAIEGKNIFILEDAAQSHGAKCGDISAGNLGDAAGISFYPSKNLGAFSDAGAITTNDSLLADAVRMLRNYGSKERYKNEVIGINSRLSELQSAFLRVKLTRLNEWNLRRKILAAIFFDHLNNVGDIILPHVPSWADPVWHLFVIRTKKRDALRNYLLEKGVGTQIHYPIPPHLSDAYTSLGYKKGDFPLAELLADEVLSLPIGPHTLASEIEFVCASIQNFFSHGN
jgi:dTDP-4-amino-4,6-dideoxygalactose transaminase